MGIFSTIIAFLAAIMLLVFIHEYGHFAVARLCGVRVKRFSIGFGKPFLTRVDRHGTEWSLAPFPMGGYVSMVDSRVEPLAPGEESVAFDKKSLWKRAAIVAAGPLINLAFAWAAWSVLLSGPAEELAPYLGSAIAGSPAAKAGFEPGDKILSVDGTPTRTLSEVQLGILNAGIAGHDARLVALRDGKTVELGLPTSSIDQEKLATGLAMMSLGFANPTGANILPRIRVIKPGGAAAEAGIKSGDLVLSIDGAAIPTWSAMAAIVNASAGKPLLIKLQDAQGKIRETTATPKAPESGPDRSAKLGVSLDQTRIAEGEKARAIVRSERSIPQAMAAAAKRCVEMTQLSLKAIWSMVVGRSGVENLSGPVGIAQQAESAAEGGAMSYLNFLAFLSLSLFLMNMLPLPALDGGHLVMFAIEGATRKPLSEKVQHRVGMAGVFLLVSLMVLALVNDISRLIG